MKSKNNININENLLELLPGLPVEPDYENEPWRKARCSCSGTGRIENKFDFLQMKTVYEGLLKK
ncbi:MAG TPA: hypothetical protein PLA51_05445 [Spirochaetota bacterium]|jgi:hypothetical protein|nr:hypothetical protein [Spirochaetota bacterium]OQA96504.1 MAG: hypothetical protein BWY23_01972 [Spirochaetes bacterium ADurb.Bin218]HON15904.1 hypothetical protein [Spirochaetota bacterium]HOQ10896.1 hypothetical protein [Spirochaetota bacterium]HOV08726.1 hypothetical protein [Spirochaetota bacterium]